MEFVEKNIKVSFEKISKKQKIQTGNGSSQTKISFLDSGDPKMLGRLHNRK